jgi:hypothetical protein
MKNKLVVILMLLILSLLLVGCNATEDDIKFYLNESIDTVEVNSEYEDPGSTAIVFGLRRKAEVLENTVDITKIGTYHISYSFTYQEITMKLTRIVTVIDETPPEVKLNPGIDTINLGDTWIDASVTADDNSKEDVTISKTGFVNTSTKGVYEIVYAVTDTSNNVTTISRFIHVI